MVLNVIDVGVVLPHHEHSLQLPLTIAIAIVEVTGFCVALCVAVTIADKGRLAAAIAERRWGRFGQTGVGVGVGVGVVTY